MPEGIIYEADLPSYNWAIRLHQNAELERAAATDRCPPTCSRTGVLCSPDPCGSSVRVWSTAMGAEEPRARDSYGGAHRGTGWSEVRVGDPHRTACVLLPGHRLHRQAIEVCRQQRCLGSDAHLAQRANFYAEFAIARWLTHTVEVGDRDGATRGVHAPGTFRTTCVPPANCSDGRSARCRPPSRY